MRNLKQRLQQLRSQSIALFLGLVVAGCSGAESNECSTGIVCPVGKQCTVSGDWCISSHGCGDGVILAGAEECDDGNHRNNDGCSDTCRLERCGDGVTQANEVCDGQGIDTAECNLNCTPARCGDTIPNKAAGEDCDDGNNLDGDGCSATCKFEKCGDNIKDALEECDHGGVETADCNTNCMAARCGDGVLNKAAGELCDDGNLLGGDGCSPICGPETCGNTLKDALEECDRGGVDTADCNANCTLARCGDGLLNKAAGEVCDDGNTKDGDGCSTTCKAEVCGDNIKDALEECDRGGVDTADCNRDCTRARCGDKYLNGAAGEVCDDGNTKDGDDCSSTCKLEKCGNNLRDALEDCDSGGVDTKECNANCKAARCGDNYVNKAAGEVCDDGNNIDGDHCSAKCDSNETCGNKIIDRTVGEACDDGNNLDGDGCSADCKSAEACGNRTPDPGEECDDGPDNNNDDCVVVVAITNGDAGSDADAGPGNDASGEGDEAGDDASGAVCNAGDDATDGGAVCDASGDVTMTTTSAPMVGVGYCRWAYCGDGYLHNQGSGKKEECDDHGVDTETCNRDCTKPRCGDGYVNRAAGEQCDEGGVDTKGCNKDCTYAQCGDNKVNAVAGEACDEGGVDTKACNKNCTKASCGDGYVNAALKEQCDEGPQGSARCNTDCTWSRCGDSKVNKLAGEQCDVNGEDATCDSDCTARVCGDGHWNKADAGTATEECDDGNNVNGDGCTANCRLEQCGNGTLDPGEQCDPDGSVDTQDCNKNCTTAHCGDGYVNRNHTGRGASGPEICDDGELNGQYTHCNSTCTAVLRCGDGITQSPQEQCDDGALNGQYNRCNSSCSAVLRCGDTITQASETCDEGTLNGQYNHCNSSCSAVLRCGDSITQSAQEQCDDGPQGSATCTATCRTIPADAGGGGG